LNSPLPLSSQMRSMEAGTSAVLYRNSICMLPRA
jgi:hypothetical protein